MILGFLKDLLEKPEKLQEMVRVYSRRMTSEIPAIEGRLKTVASEIRQTERKIENLIARLSEFPKEISVEPIYRQLKTLNQKLDFRKETQVQLTGEMNKATTKAIDQAGLRKRIEEAVAALRTVPIEKQRPIFANVIHFAELRPMKVRLGLYAPLMRAGSTSIRNTARRENRTLTGFPIRS